MVGIKYRNNVYKSQTRGLSINQIATQLLQLMTKEENQKEHMVDY